MIIHNGYKILSDMPKFIFYLFENFKSDISLSGLWPQTNQEEIVCVFEWYATKLRPFMWEFYGIMTATNQAGLSNQFLEDEGGNIDPRENEANKVNSKLQKVHDEYMQRFKFFCEQMENKFFKPNKNGAVNPFIFGDKITVVDHVYYQELLSAMILSG